MDTIRGVPALADSDSLASVGQYSRELRTYLYGDTGWQPISIPAGYENKSGTADARRIGSIVYLRGLIGPTSGTLPTGTQVIIGTIPSGFRPASSQWFVGGSSTGQPTGTIVVVAGGEIQFRPPGGTVGMSYVGLASATYPVG